MTELHETCIRCGRKLKNQKSKELGFGIVCWQKWQEEHDIKKLFSMGGQDIKENFMKEDEN